MADCNGNIIEKIRCRTKSHCNCKIFNRIENEPIEMQIVV